MRRNCNDKGREVMNYYAEFSKAGRLISKVMSEDRYAGEGILALSESEYFALDVEREQEIFDLKKMLLDTDYIACKIAEGSATREEYADMIAQRQAWRARINTLGG